MTLSEKIAHFVINPAPFTDKAVYLAVRSIIDTMGAMVIGSSTSAVEMAEETVPQGGNCTVIGNGRKVLNRDAAFINGISGHELELDDTSSSNLGHPTVAVLPSLLAIGEERGCSGRKLIEAFLVATEVECKIGRICARKLHEKGWHASSITGVIGAAAGSAYVMELDEEKTRNAIGIAASMASGVRDNFGTLTKSIHIGKTAEDGLRAALLAEKGFTSSSTALEGKEGYIFEYAGIRDKSGEFDEIIDSMGHDWDICSPGFTLKRYPSCSSTHRPVDALIDLIDENNIKADDVERIDVGLSESALRELVTPYPKDGEEAKFSVGFQTALHLAGMENMPYNYVAEVIAEIDIQNIIRRTFMYEEEKYNNLPSDMGVGPAFVTIRLRDGRTFSKERKFPVGHLTDPISDEDLKAKFFTCANPILGETKSEKLYENLLNLNGVSNIKETIFMTY
ncbi:MAG: MmgE/PrpD family protein [Anaerovoracaceae bacterium]